MRQEKYFGHDWVTIIEPRRGLAGLDMRELWAYRDLLWVLLTRDIRVRYKQTLLGAGWAILRPLLSTLVFTVVFGRMAKMPSEGAPYALFALAGVLPWTFFSSAVAAAGESLVGSQHLVSKIYFPRLLIPLSVLGACVVDLTVGLLVLVAMSLWYGVGITLSWVALPLLVAFLVLCSVGIGTLFAALNVTYRDVRHLIPYALQVWLYATPVVYPPTLFPEQWRWLLYLNPAAGPIEAFRAVVLDRAVDVQGLAVSLAASLLILAVALLYFGRVERRFADVI